MNKWWQKKYPLIDDPVLCNEVKQAPKSSLVSPFSLNI